MREVLGTVNAYNDQTNDASVDLMRRYTSKGKMISCGPNSCACGLEIGKWPNVFTPGEQWPDGILNVFHNRFNASKFLAVRDIDIEKYPPNEIPQFYPVLGEILYGTKECMKFNWGLSFELIKKNIQNGITTMLCGKFPAGGHYVLAVGYDDNDINDRKIIFNDSYPKQWADKKGYNREMTMDFFEKNISKYRIEILPYKG